MLPTGARVLPALASKQVILRDNNVLPAPRRGDEDHQSADLKPEKNTILRPSAGEKGAVRKTDLSWIVPPACYPNRSCSLNRYCPSFPSKFDAPMQQAFPVFAAARIPAFMAACTASSPVPFMTIS